MHDRIGVFLESHTGKLMSPRQFDHAAAVFVLACVAMTHPSVQAEPPAAEAEAIRDNILVVSSVLDLRMGGPGFSAFEVQKENVRHYFPKPQCRSMR